jgi:hypothetical protein
MIIWSGHGYLVAVIVFLSSLAMEFATESAAGNDRFYQQSVWALPAAFLMAAVLTFVVERAISARSTDRHTLFFIPMKWWPLVLAGLAVVVLSYRMANGAGGAA